MSELTSLQISLSLSLSLSRVCVYNARQDIPGVTYCSSSELKNNAQICTEMSHAEPLAYEAINNAENNPYGTHERGGYTNRTRYRSWFIVSMSFLVPLTGMLATHAMFLRSRLGWFHREGEGEESDVGFENFERFFERMSVHNNACLRFFRLRRASDDDVLRKNTETYKSAAWDEAASWEEVGRSKSRSDELRKRFPGVFTSRADTPLRDVSGVNFNDVSNNINTTSNASPFARRRTGLRRSTAWQASAAGYKRQNTIPPSHQRELILDENTQFFYFFLQLGLHITSSQLSI